MAVFLTIQWFKIQTFHGISFQDIWHREVNVQAISVFPPISLADEDYH